MDQNSCAHCRTTNFEDWSGEYCALNCYHLLCAKCTTELPDNTNSTCTFCNTDRVVVQRFSNLVITNALTELKDCKQQIESIKSIETSTTSKCTKCEELVRHTQLFICDHDVCRSTKSNASDFEGFFEQSICGSCAMPHFLEHGTCVKKAFTTAVSVASKTVTNDFVEEIDNIFDKDWGEMIGAVNNLKTDIQKKLSKEALISFFESSKSLNEYNDNVNKMKDIIQNLRDECDDLKNKVSEQISKIEDISGGFDKISAVL